MASQDPKLVADAVTYGPHHQEHLLEQYRLYVEMADHVSERRDKANSFFLTVNTAMLTVAGLVLSSQGRSPLLLLLVLPAMIFCYFWYRIVASYQQLSSAKFKVIGELEKSLPCSPYAFEWKELGEGKDPSKYRPLSHVEQNVPWVFMGLYVLLAAVSLALPVTEKEQQVRLSGGVELRGPVPGMTAGPGDAGHLDMDAGAAPAAVEVEVDSGTPPR